MEIALFLGWKSFHPISYQVSHYVVTGRVIVFRNYLIIALRNLKRQKTFSAINILGLAIGLGTCILIVLYIQDELSFDSWHAKGDRIYQVIRETRAGGQSDYLPYTSGALAGALERDFPEVEKAVRVMLLFPDVRLEKKKFEMGVCVADPELFEIFDFPFVRGNLETAFPNPNAIAITESSAKRLFGDEDPIGKTITAESNHHGGERTITAVLKDVPHNSTLQFDYVSTGGFTSGGAKYLWENWQPTTGWRPVNTYFLLREETDSKGAVREASRIYRIAIWGQRSRVQMRIISSLSIAFISIRGRITIWIGTAILTAFISLALLQFWCLRLDVSISQI